MGLLDTLVGAFSGSPQTTGTAGANNQLLGALSGLLTQNGGLQGLMSKFTQSGLGDTFASWVGMGNNRPISPEQVHQALGPDQLQQLAAQLGTNPSEASSFLAEHLPKIVDKLTPDGQVDPGADHHQGLAALLPSLLQSLGR